MAFDQKVRKDLESSSSPDLCLWKGLCPAHAGSHFSTSIGRNKSTCSLVERHRILQHPEVSIHNRPQLSEKNLCSSLYPSRDQCFFPKVSYHVLWEETPKQKISQKYHIHYSRALLGSIIWQKTYSWHFFLLRTFYITWHLTGEYR